MNVCVTIRVTVSSPPELTPQAVRAMVAEDLKDKLYGTTIRRHGRPTDLVVSNVE